MAGSNVSGQIDKQFLLSVVLASFLVMAPYLGSSLRVSVIVALTLVLAGIVSRMFFSLAITLLVVASTIAFHVKTNWGMTYLDSRVEVALIAPAFEVIEYIHSYFSISDTLVLIGNLLSLFFCWRAVTRFRDRTLFLHTIAIVVLVPVVTMLLLTKHNRIGKLLPLQFVATTYDTFMRVDRVSNRQLGAQLEPAGEVCGDAIYDTVVVIVGEAALSDRMSVYGYPKPTTPFLESVDPFVFDAISPGNQTRFSIPMILTPANVSNFSTFYESPSVITRLKNCGYETHWFSNQGRAGRYETNTTTIAMEADHTHFINNLGWQEAGYDGQLVERLATQVSDDSGKRAIFVHLIGSHIGYSQRYPDEFALSPGVDMESHYDNSIFYTDHVLSEINRLFQGDDSLFVYLSDHGEVVSNEKFGHGHFPSYGEEFRIPLVVWSQHDERPAKLAESSAGRVINAESFDNLLTYLVGIENGANPSYSTTVFSIDPMNKMDHASLSDFVRPRALSAALRAASDNVSDPTRSID